MLNKRDVTLNTRITNFCKYLIVSVAVAAVMAPVYGAAPVNMRGGDTGARNSGRATSRADDSVATTISANVARTARRGGTVSARGAGATLDVNAANPRSAVRVATDVAARTAGATASVRSATKTNAARSAVMTNARGAGATTNVSDVSRASVSRATAIFNDISKMGTGYANCREAYATCMDQLCAKANDTYRRCFCSERFVDFRDTEEALDAAKNLLMKFEDNNLNAVDKTAAEVAAMYSASEGERAIKEDTSGAAKMLEEIGDLLSGKRKTETKSISQSLGVLDFDFSGDVGDIWGGGGGGSSIFSGGSGVDLTELEGQELYNQAHKQCVSLIADSCENDAVFSMAKSSYSILISQDCNAYQKSLNSKRSAVEQTVRTAEKYLREARLEEYRSHNSADVNECIAKVRSALTQDTACGANYKRCLDYTGAYINQSTGDPIYSTKLFKLADLINLPGLTGAAGTNSGVGDILDSNPEFDDFLDSRKMFAEEALDTCRDISKNVWDEFKRTALIEISQAQDEKIEEVKNSCVSTMKECYDTQSDALKSFDDNTAQVTGALTAYASRAMCEEKVLACAALYGSQGCNVDQNGKVSGDGCGLAQLKTFVSAVDDVRAAEGCAGAIDTFVRDLCTPSTEGQEYPWNCRTLAKGVEPTDAATVSSMPAAGTIAQRITRFALNNCLDPNSGGSQTFGDLQEQTQNQVRNAIQDVADQVYAQLSDVCKTLGGEWISLEKFESMPTGDADRLEAYYSTVFAGNYSGEADYGVCVQQTDKIICLAENIDGMEPMATYNDATKECRFTPAWYQNKCESVGGTYENSACYVLY